MAQACRPRYTYMLLRSLPKADTDALPSMIGSHDPFSGAFSRLPQSRDTGAKVM